jgi:hypothetical protein
MATVAPQDVYDLLFLGLSVREILDDYGSGQCIVEDIHKQGLAKLLFLYGATFTEVAEAYDIGMAEGKLMPRDLVRFNMTYHQIIYFLHKERLTVYPTVEELADAGAHPMQILKALQQGYIRIKPTAQELMGLGVGIQDVLVERILGRVSGTICIKDLLEDAAPAGVILNAAAHGVLDRKPLWRELVDAGATLRQLFDALKHDKLSILPNHMQLLKQGFTIEFVSFLVDCGYACEVPKHVIRSFTIEPLVQHKIHLGYYTMVRTDDCFICCREKELFSMCSTGHDEHVMCQDCWTELLTVSEMSWRKPMESVCPFCREALV